MRPIFLAWVLALPTPGLATPAAPAAVTITIGGVEIAITPPEGSCPASGDAAAGAQLMAAADSANVTLATLVSCRAGQGAFDSYYILKTPRTALLATMSRAEFLKQAGPAFAAIDLDAVVAKAQTEANGVLNGAATVDAGQIRPVGQDEDCAYIAGSGQVAAAGSAEKIAVAACLTVVKQKLLTIYKFEPQTSAAVTAGLLASVKSLARRIIADNE